MTVQGDIALYGRRAGTGVTAASRVNMAVSSTTSVSVTRATPVPTVTSSVPAMARARMTNVYVMTKRQVS